VRIDTSQIHVIDSRTIDALGLSPRVRNALKRFGVREIEHLVNMSKKQILTVPWIGKKGAAEIEQKLSDYLVQHSEVLVDEKRIASSPPLVTQERLERFSETLLDSISVDRLLYPSFEANYLARQGIKSVGQLARRSTAAIPSECLFVDRLNRYLDWLAEQEQETQNAESTGKRISPIHGMLLSETTLDALVEAWFDCLNPREREVIRNQSGLYGPKMTMEEMGKRFGVTAPRVSQIKKQALYLLSTSMAQRAILSLKQCLVEAFCDAGGLMTEEEVQATICELTAVNEVNVPWITNLLLDAASEFELVMTAGVWGNRDFHIYNMPRINRLLTDILEEIGGLVPHHQLMTRFSETSSNEKYEDASRTKLVEACLRTHPDIECVEGKYMIRGHQDHWSYTDFFPAAFMEPKLESPPSTSLESGQAFDVDLENVEPLDRPPETLQEWEQYLRSQIREAELLAEIAITRQECAQIGQAIALHVQDSGHIPTARTLKSKYPCTTAIYLVVQGIYSYQDGDYWTEVLKQTGFNRNAKEDLGRIFEDTLKALDLPLFPDMRSGAFRYVSLILIHGGIPNHCLPDFFANFLQPAVYCAEYDDLSAAELIDMWGQQTNLIQQGKRPVTRFLIYGGRVAKDFLERCREMVRIYDATGSIPAAEEVSLPERVVAAYSEWVQLGQRGK
jgi:hypothetical protein